MESALPYYTTIADETVRDIHARPCKLHSIHLVNGDAGSVRYVQLFDAASGDVTLGTTSPDLVVPIGEGDTHHIEFATPVRFGTACSFAVTTTPTGSTGPTQDAFLSATLS